MAELLKTWVNSLGINSKINDFEKDLANGYCYGEILVHPSYDLMTSETFATFANNDSAEAKVGNFQNLAPVLGSLGIKFDSLIANQIMTEKHGVALQLLHKVKQALQSLQTNAFSSSTAISGFKPGDTVKQPTSVSYLSGAKTTGKTRFETIEKERFEDKLKKMVPNSYTQKLALHLKPFQDYADKIAEENVTIENDERERDRLLQVDNRQYMLDKYHHNKQFMQEWQKQGVKQHAANMGNRRDEIKRCLRNEMAVKENKLRKAEITTETMRVDVDTSIDAFETTLRRLGKADTEELTDKEVKARLTGPQISTIEHMKAIERSLPKFEDMGVAADNYVRSIKKKKGEEDISKKERDRRRRKVLLDQQSAQKELEMKRKEEMLLEKLCRQSKEERKVAESLWECQLHKEILRENRKTRDRQEEAAATRAKELKNEAEKGAREAQYQEYQRRIEETVRRRDEFEARLIAEKNARNYATCLEAFEGVLDIVARVALYRQDTDGGWPSEELTEWTVAWTQLEPLWPPPPPPLDPAIEAERAQHEANQRDPMRVLEEPMLDETEWQRYLNWSGPWAWRPKGEPLKELPPSTSRPPPEGSQTSAICDLVQSLDACVTALEPVSDRPDLPPFPVGVAVIGKPFSGKSDMCKAMAAKGVTVISADAVVAKAVDGYRHCMMAGQKPDNSRFMQLGISAFEQLAQGHGVSDDTVTNLIICEIQTLAASDTPTIGWCLDGFPVTLNQAQILEKALSGFSSPALSAGAGVFSELASLGGTSKTAKSKEKGAKDAKLCSGLLNLVVLEILDSTAEERAHGAVFDIEEKKRYHLSSDPPNLGSGSFGRLVPEENESSADMHIGPRIVAANASIPALKDFFNRFNVVLDVDAEQPMSKIQYIAEELVADLEYKFTEHKAVVMKARPPTSLSFVADKVGMQADAIPMTNEMIQDLQLSELLLSQWVEIEQRYKHNAKSIFSKLRSVRREAVPHFREVRDSFMQFLKRPDERQVVAEKFHDGFNAIEEWMRSDIEVKQELHLRCDEVLEAMWDVSDKRKDLANEERFMLLGSGWLQNKCSEVTVSLAQLLSFELMRYQASRSMIEADYKFQKDREIPDASAILDVALVLAEAMIPPAEGPPPRPPKAEDGSMPCTPSIDLLSKSLRDCLDSALALIPSEDLDQHPQKETLILEVKFTQERLRTIADRGVMLMKALHHRGEVLGKLMEQWLEARYTAEVASSTGFAAQVREAIEAEEMLVHDIQLEDTEFTIDEGTRLAPYILEVTPQGKEAEPLPDRFTLLQLNIIHEHLLNTAPSGLILREDFVWLFRRLVADGAGPLPLEWLSSDENVVVTRLQQLAQDLDVFDAGGVSWRDFLVVAAIPSYPSLGELLEMRKAFSAASATGDSRVTQEEYKSVRLWFEANSKMDDAKKEGIKALLYQLFVVPDPNQPDNDEFRFFDFLACLLHCCADDPQELGVAKAFKVVAAGDAPLRKEEVARIATAGVGVLSDMQVAALAQVFSGKSEAARSQLEPIMADPHGRNMLMSQSVYLRKKIYH